MIKETTQKHCDSNSCCGIRRVTFHASLTQESQGLETALDMLRGPGCSPHGLGAVVSSKSWPNTIKAELAVEALRSQPGALTRLPASRDSCHAQVCIALSTRDGNGDFHLTHPNMEAQLIKGSQIERRSKSHQSLAPRGLNWSWLVKKRLKWSSVILPGRTWSSKQKEFPFWERELVVCLPTSQDFFFFFTRSKSDLGSSGSPSKLPFLFSGQRMKQYLSPPVNVCTVAENYDTSTELGSFASPHYSELSRNWPRTPTRCPLNLCSHEGSVCIAV